MELIIFVFFHSLYFSRIFANIIYFLLSPYLYLKVLAFVLVWEKLKHKDIKENNLFFDIYTGENLTVLI